MMMMIQPQSSDTDTAPTPHSPTQWLFDQDIAHPLVTPSWVRTVLGGVGGGGSSGGGLLSGPLYKDSQYQST